MSIATFGWLGRTMLIQVVGQINFSVYTYGASADYDRWADEVGDDAWRWENVQKRFAKVCH